MALHASLCKGRCGFLSGILYSISDMSGCSAVGSAGGLGQSSRGFESRYPDDIANMLSIYEQKRYFCQYISALAPLAQMVEQRTFTPWVVGSIPTWGTRALTTKCSLAE